MVCQLNCPICRSVIETTDEAVTFLPFCSERCRNVDLLRWSDGRYAIVEPIDPTRHADLLDLDSEHEEPT